MDYRFVELPATITAEQETYDPDLSPFADVLAESLGPWWSQLAKLIEGMVESAIQMLSVEIQAGKLNQIDKNC